MLPLRWLVFEKLKKRKPGTGHCKPGSAAKLLVARCQLLVLTNNYQPATNN
jgi:hypothetical protein